MEQNLEDWIEREPGLLQTGLTIVGRQVGLESGRLDLLALDPQGHWVVIEIKSGDLRREAVAQVLDYASCIATMPHDELRQKVNEYLNQRPEPPAALSRAASGRGRSSQRGQGRRDLRGWHGPGARTGEPADAVSTPSIRTRILKVTRRRRRSTKDRKFPPRRSERGY